MVLKSAFIAAVCTGVLALAGSAMAAEYRPAEYLKLDLSKALISPKRLGPEARFAPVRIEARTDARPVKTERVVAPKASAPKIRVATRVVQERAEKPRGAARVKLARRHTNPLDAQARDTRIQTWPCKSGGICGWQR